MLESPFGVHFTKIPHVFTSPLCKLLPCSSAFCPPVLFKLLVLRVTTLFTFYLFLSFNAYISTYYAPLAIFKTFCAFGPSSFLKVHNGTFLPSSSGNRESEMEGAQKSAWGGTNTGSSELLICVHFIVSLHFTECTESGAYSHKAAMRRQRMLILGELKGQRGRKRPYVTIATRESCISLCPKQTTAQRVCIQTWPF